MKNLKITKYIVNICALVLVLTWSTQLSSLANNVPEEERYKDWNRLNELAEQVFFLAQKSEFEASRKQLRNLSTYFLSLKTGDYVDRLEQVQVLTETLVQAEEMLNAVNISPEQVQNKILRLKLALDAVSHKKQPLWLNYYPSIAQTMDELYVAGKEGKRDSFYHYANRLATEYEFIRPSLVMTHEVQIVEKMDSKIKYLTEKRSELWNDQKNRTAFLEGLNQDWKKVFFQADEESSQSFIYLMVGIGTLICSVLSYVAWRKYKGEKEIKKVVWKK